MHDVAPAPAGSAERPPQLVCGHDGRASKSSLRSFADLAGDGCPSSDVATDLRSPSAADPEHSGMRLDDLLDFSSASAQFASSEAHAATGDMARMPTYLR